MIDGKVFAINRARAEARHAAQTSQLSQENASLRAESALAHQLGEANKALRALLLEALAAEGAVLPDSWHDRAKSVLGIRVKKTKRRGP